MGDLSVAVLVGRLTRDAELKYTNSGQAICHFSVATSSRVKKGDQWIDESSFWDIDLWGKRAESLNQYLTKGKLVAVQGDMRQDKWEQDGQNRMKVKITANDVQLLGSGQGGPSGGGSSGSSSSSGAPRERPPAGGGGNASPRGPAREADSEGDGGFVDDIPF